MTENRRDAAVELISALDGIIVGKRDVLVLFTAAILSGSHVLLEDIPGTGKTTLASSVASLCGLKFNRAQFTPDLTPSDITGYNIYNRQKESFEFRSGLVMCNILLADEINRASPKTQSALLEAMEEERVTVDGVTYELSKPFAVIATQNPAGFVGTYPLPEAQLDRFGISLTLGYPTAEQERMIVEGKLSAASCVKPSALLGAEDIMQIREDIKRVTLCREVIDYAVALVRATRTHPSVSLGASARCSIALTSIARALAYICGRDYVIPEDIARLFIPVTGHRISLKYASTSKSVSKNDVLSAILKSTRVPFIAK